MVNIELLRKFSLFQELDESLLDEFAAYIQVKHYNADSSICFLEDRGDEIFFIVKGSLSVVLPLYRFDSRYRIASEIEEGNFFGELSFIDGKKRSANIRAKEDVDLLVLSRRDYDKVIKHNHEAGCRIQGKIIARMVRIIRDMNETYSSAGFRF